MCCEFGLDGECCITGFMGTGERWCVSMLVRDMGSEEMFFAKGCGTWGEIETLLLVRGWS